MNILFLKKIPTICKQILFILILFLSLADGVAARKTRLVYVTQYLPQAEFAGYYVAQAQGFYKAEGLDVEIISPSVSSSGSMSYLTEGKADIVSAFLVKGILSHQADKNIVNIAQISQHSSLLLVAKKGSGIKTLADFEGKKVGTWPQNYFDVTTRALIGEKHLRVNWVPVTSVNPFLVKGGVDVMLVLSYNEYYQLYLSGINENELNKFYLSDYGYDIPEAGLYTTKQILNTKRAALSAFVRASIKGWQYAAQHRDYAVALVLQIMRKAHLPANKANQMWMLNQMIDLQSKKNKKVQKTMLLPSDFEKTIKVLQNNKLLKKPVLYKDFFYPVFHSETK